MLQISKFIIVFNSGNQHHRSYATFPQNSSANLAQSSDLRTTHPVDYEARWSSTDQINSSMQQSILPEIHQQTGYEENAAAEMFSQYGVMNRNPYYPETSDFMSPGMHHIQENEPHSTHFLLPSEASKVFIPFNPEYPTNIPMSVTEQSILTGSQQTFGQRNALMHQMAQHPSAFSQTECSGISTTNELPPHFSSTYHNFGESDHTLTNRVSQYSEKSLEMLDLASQIEICNPMSPTSHNSVAQQTQRFSSFSSLSCDFSLERPSFFMDTFMR
ncbi:hypothetical protein CEXT_423041 [Caerostris extrusa]|uniref:Uncharacterized protein n=1 Tax=Caerostris extrusa TaxID=172846 RepID=A0AAV4R8A6_CAEEX|nr:hypothetical protein CEXT_423041 [Caerostris extrusa]